MKVGLVVDSPISRPGGAQEYVLGLYDFLKKEGNQPIIYTSGRYTKKQKQGREIVSFGTPFHLPGDASKGINLVFGKGKKVKKVLRKEKPEILHIQAMPGPLGLNFLRHSNSVNIMTFLIAHEIKGVGFLAKSLSPLWKAMKKNLHGKIAISKVAEAYAQKFLPGPYEIIPIGVDLHRFSPKVSKIAKFKDRKVNILFVGRLDKRKGIQYLLKAYHRLSQQISDVRLIIVGDGPKKQKARDYVRKEELKNVVFAGAVSRQALPSWYATADIFCSPATHGESFGVVLLEAMASGLPVVAFDNPGYKCVFPDFGRDFLVPIKNVSALTRALLTLVTKPKLRKELSRKNLKYAQRFSWEQVGEETLRFYQRLLRQFPTRG